MANVLIVDDDIGLTRALAVRLKHAGFEVCSVNNADAAAGAAHQHRPDVILLDIDMPHYNGLEFHECLRISPRMRTIPIVYLSGHDTDFNRRMAFEQGARAFVTKPYESTVLLRILQEIVGSRTEA